MGNIRIAALAEFLSVTFSALPYTGDFLKELYIELRGGNHPSIRI